jgi:hypothetical protein
LFARSRLGIGFHSDRYPNQRVERVAASLSWAPSTCRSEPIQFAISSVGFVSYDKLGLIRIGGFASMKNPGRNFQRMHSTRELFSVPLQKLVSKRFHRAAAAAQIVLRPNRRGDRHP